MSNSLPELKLNSGFSSCPEQSPGQEPKEIKKMDNIKDKVIRINLINRRDYLCTIERTNRYMQRLLERGYQSYITLNNACPRPGMIDINISVTCSKGWSYHSTIYADNLHAWIESIRKAVLQLHAARPQTKPDKLQEINYALSTDK